MAKKGNPNPNQGGNVSQIPERCPVDKCGKKTERSSFCKEHFIWFKEGLVSRKGEKPKDFDKKYQAFARRQKTAA